MTIKLHTSDDYGLFLDKHQNQPYISVRMTKGSDEEKAVINDTMNNWYTVESKRLFEIKKDKDAETDELVAFILLRAIQP